MSSPSSRRASSCLALVPLLFSPQVARAQAEARPPVANGREHAAEIDAGLIRVVDGDTLEVELDGEAVTLRLLSVDTEEKISGRAGGSPSKPQTVFGEETVLWTRDLFAGLEPASGRRVRVGLSFPEGRRADAYGRLLAHVFLPDGRDLNLLLVEQGRSPYFNKYGNSLVAHAAFVRAQESARAARIGIWDPDTNRTRTPGAPSAVRPYERLLPWWDARAAAVDAFRSRASRERNGSPHPGPSESLPTSHLLSAEDPSAFPLALEHCRIDPALRVTVFTTIERFYDEPDGALTALLRSGDEHTALRATVTAAERARLEPFLRASTEEFRQNYLYVTGRMERHARGFLLTGAALADWTLAEPAYPP